MINALQNLSHQNNVARQIVKVTDAFQRQVENISFYPVGVKETKAVVESVTKWALENGIVVVEESKSGTSVFLSLPY